MNRAALLKKYRSLARLSQADVAKAMGISQPTYQRWETGAADVPDRRLSKLSQVLQVKVEQLKGPTSRKPSKDKPTFDYTDTDEEISDDRTYFGEVAFHFAKSGANLLLPITVAVRNKLLHQLVGNEKFLTVNSIDNRFVLVRRGALKDVNIHHDACDDFGPEEYQTKELYCQPDDDFWHIMEYADSPEHIEDLYEKEHIEKVLHDNYITYERHIELCNEHNIPEIERDAKWAEVSEDMALIESRCTEVIWQFSEGTVRKESVQDEDDFYQAFYPAFEFDLYDEDISWHVEGWYKTIYIRLGALDYLHIPSHKFNLAEARALEELDEN